MRTKLLFLIGCLSLLSVIEAWGVSVTFKVSSWDGNNKQVVTTTDTRDATVLSGDHEEDWIALSDGYYVVMNDTKYKVLNIIGDDVHLILSNNAVLLCNHVKLEGSHKLHIHQENATSGTLRTINGAYYYRQCSVKGGGHHTKIQKPIYHTAAAIGSGNETPMGSLYVHGGNVYAVTAGHGAAIGGGYGSGIGGEVVVYDGMVKAFVKCHQSNVGAAIGGGYDADQGGPVTIYGGTVRAVINFEFSVGAAIGGGEDGNGGTVNIWGGDVYARGGKYSTGIGGGYKSKGGDVHIYGGTVEARCGEEYSAIGGYRGKDKGTIEFADNMKVNGGSVTWIKGGDNVTDPFPTVERVFTAAEREAACQYRTWVKVEACPHTAPTDGSDKTEAIYYTVDDDKTHTKHCRYCNATWKENHSGETCVCGEKTRYSFTVFYPGAETNTYKEGVTTTVGGGKQFTMPVCSNVPEGYEFKGWEMNPTEENKNKWCNTPNGLVQPQTSVSAEGSVNDAKYYARFAKVYTTSWTWIRTAGGVQATVTIQHKGETVASETSGPSNPNMEITWEDLTEAMTVEYDDKPAEEIDFVIGKRYNATCNYTNADGHNYVFTDSYDVVDDLTLQNGSDNTEAISYNILFPVNAAIDGRTLYKDGKWNTLCLPFDICSFTGTPLEGATVMTLDVEGTYGDKKTGYDASTGVLSLYFEETDWIEAGVPYLVKWATGSDITDLVFNNFTIYNDDPDETKLVSEDCKVTFIGNYAPVPLTGGDKSTLYLGADNKLYWPSADKNLDAFRAYFKVDLGTGGYVREIKLNLDSTTGVEEVSGFKIQVSGSGWYDMSGRKLNSKPTQKGVYIHNGKKVAM